MVWPRGIRTHQGGHLYHEQVSLYRIESACPRNSWARGRMGCSHSQSVTTMIRCTHGEVDMASTLETRLPHLRDYYTPWSLEFRFGFWEGELTLVWMSDTALVSVPVEREVWMFWRSALLGLEFCAYPGALEPLRMYFMAGSERNFIRCGPMSVLTASLGCA